MISKPLLDCSSIIRYHGFLLWRHPSKEATCIQYKAADGNQKTLAVKDAKFRDTKQFGTYAKDIPELSLFSQPGTQSWWLTINSIDYNAPMPDYITNESIFQNWSASLASDKTAKENCDVWMKYNTYRDSQNVVGVPAVAWCRSQKLNGIPCDLPNEYQIACIWACGDIIDKIDTTHQDYSNLGLGYTSNKGFNGWGRTHTGSSGETYWGNVWSSTTCNYVQLRHVHLNGCCGTDSFKHQVGLVVPILELDTAS